MHSSDVSQGSSEPISSNGAIRAPAASSFVPRPSTFAAFVSASLSRMGRSSSSPDRDKREVCDGSSSTLFMTILQDIALTARLLEVILDARPDPSLSLFEPPSLSFSGRPSLSRLARTCQALKEPALSLLWRDLDSVEPLVALFPSVLEYNLRGRATLHPRYWTRVLAYGKHVRSLSWECMGDYIPPHVCSLLEKGRNRPDYILPNLVSFSCLSWIVDSDKHCNYFLGPKLQILMIRQSLVPPDTLHDTLVHVAAHRNLTSISLETWRDYPFDFVGAVPPHQVTWEHVSLSGSHRPSSLFRFVTWLSALPKLKSFERSGFSSLHGFAEVLQTLDDTFIVHRSSPALPTNNTSPYVADPDGSLGKDLDKIAPAKGLPSGGRRYFPHLTYLRLCCDTSAGLELFLRQLASPLNDLDLSIMAGYQRVDALPWNELCAISEVFGETLRTLRIHGEYQRVPPDRTEGLPTLLGSLPHLRHLTFDFPELERAFDDADIVDIATAYPGLTELRLSPVVRFPLQSNTRRRLIWDYARRDSPEGSVKYEELEPRQHSD